MAVYDHARVKGKIESLLARNPKMSLRELCRRAKCSRYSTYRCLGELKNPRARTGINIRGGYVLGRGGKTKKVAVVGPVARPEPGGWADGLVEELADRLARRMGGRSDAVPVPVGWTLRWVGWYEWHSRPRFEALATDPGGRLHVCHLTPAGWSPWRTTAS